MGTDLIEEPIHVRRFYGGKERGVCYQFTIGDKWEVLTQVEFNAFIGRCMQLSPNFIPIWLFATCENYQI